MHGKWNGSMTSFFAYMIVADCALYILDWDNGVYEDRRSFCMCFRLFSFIYVDRPYAFAYLGRPSTTALQRSR